MAEYPIIAKLDPQTAAGTNKVKQDLRGIAREARATETAIARSFDQTKFDRSIGGLVTRLEQLDKTMGALPGQLAKYAKAGETTAQATDRLAAAEVAAAKGAATLSASTAGATGNLDRMTAAEFRAAGGLDGLNQKQQQNVLSQAQMEAALGRVLRATDQTAAEQLKMNQLLADAKRLLDAGAISQDRYAQVQKMATEVGKQQVVQTGAQRIGMQQLGYQLGDVATMYSLGAKPAQIFGSQIGQITQAVQLMSNGTSKWAAFLGGPWGVALSVGAILLAPFVAKLFEGNDALADSIEKLRKDAEETRINAEAKKAFAKTIEGVTAAIRDQNEELKKSLETQRSAQLQGMATARTNLQILENDRAVRRQAIEDAKALYEIDKQRASGSGPGAEQAALRLPDSLQRIKDAEARYASLDQTIRSAEEAIRRADAAFAQGAAERAVDPVKKLNDEYDELRRKTIEAAVASTDYSVGALAKELTQLELRRKKALEAAQAQEKLNKATSDGVARFRSREQAIGIAGREIRAAGLPVGENQQFGGVKGNHPGMGNAAHSKYAIDVDIPNASDKAPTPPDIKGRYDQMARRYQQRGYRVLWAGNVYEPGGSGPSRKIPSGQNQHYGHMHLEAPQAIVGKPTQAGAEADINREAGQQARVAERAEDFVKAIQIRQAGVGLPADRQTQLNAQIDEALAEFNRRFEREATPDERAAIGKAFTDADARDTAQRFEEAYVMPLQRLKDLQGTTGLARDVLNAKLDETARLGRELTPIEAQMIENAVLHSDALQRQAQLLEQVRQPLEQYKATIAALNELLAKGAISQTQYNAQIAGLATTVTGGLGGLQGIDPGTGRNYDDIAAAAEEDARFAKQLADFETYREQLLQMGIDYDALVEAAHKDHVARLAEIDAARKDQQLAAAQDIAGSMLSIIENTIGKQNALYKAMFAVEKAVAIARAIVAIQTGIAQAAALPFPANLPAIASVVAATASIVSNISAVALNFKDGGMVRGPGGPRSDSIPANLSNGEFVVNARATAANKPLLEAMNSGQTIRQQRAVSVAEAAPQQRSRVTLIQHPGVALEQRENLTTGDVEVIARTIMQREAGDVFAAEIAKPNSRAKKAIINNTTAKPKRS